MQEKRFSRYSEPEDRCHSAWLENRQGRVIHECVSNMYRSTDLGRAIPSMVLLHVQEIPPAGAHDSTGPGSRFRNNLVSERLQDKEEGLDRVEQILD